MKTILISAAVVLLTACNTTTEKEQIPEPVAPPVEPAVVAADTIRVDAVTSATAMPNHSSFNGTMIVPPQRHATVTLTMGGTVHSTPLLPGDYVKKVPFSPPSKTLISSCCSKVTWRLMLKRNILKPNTTARSV